MLDNEVLLGILFNGTMEIDISVIALFVFYQSVYGRFATLRFRTRRLRTFSLENSLLGNFRTFPAQDVSLPRCCSQLFLPLNNHSILSVQSD